MATTPNSGMSQEDISSYLALAQALGVAAKPVAQMAADFERLKEKARNANDVLEDMVSTAGKLSKQLGMTGAVVNKLAGGIKSQFSKMGADINLDMRKVNSEMAKGLEGTAGRFKRAWSSATIGAKEVGKQLASSLEDPKNQLGMLEKSVEFLHSRFKVIDTDAASLARSLNVTFDTAQGVRDNFNQVALASKEASITGKSLTKSTVEMNTALGTSAQFSAERLTTYTKLRDVAKFEAEVLNDINKMSLVNGETVEKTAKSRLSEITRYKILNRLQIDERKVMSDIAKLSASIKINYIGRDKDLAKAATQARALGLELSQVDKMADSLMNFEQSITAQMTAEVLTGQTLNLERARYYALTNDLSKVQQELTSQGITQEKFSSMNRIQQEAIATSLGMSKEEMSKMFIEQKALQAVSASSVSEAQKMYNSKKTLAEKEEFLAKLGNESLERQFQQQSLQDRMNMALEKMLSVFDKLAIAFRPLYKLAEGFLNFIILIEEKLGGLSRGLATVMGNQAVQKIANMGGKVSEASVQTGSGLTAKALESAGLTSITKGATGAAAASAIQKAGGGMLKGATEGGAVDFSKILPKMGKNAFSKVLSSGIVAPLVEGWLATTDINGMIADKNIPDTSLTQKVGERAYGGIGAVIGSVSGAGLVNLLNLVGIPGFLATTAAATLGGAGGQWLASKAAESLGATGMGEALLGTFFDGEMKAAGRPELATGGLVTQGGLAKVDTGEVYLGANSLQVLKDLVTETRQQNQYLRQIASKDTALIVDGKQLASTVANGVATSYGNILRPSSRTYA